MRRLAAIPNRTRASLVHNSVPFFIWREKSQPIRGRLYSPPVATYTSNGPFVAWRRACCASGDEFLAYARPMRSNQKRRRSARVGGDAFRVGLPPDDPAPATAIRGYIMLTLFDRDSRRSRRSFLRIGGSAALGAGGLTLADLATARARDESIPGVLTGKSVIFLFLHGGPSQFETFDPKMDMPDGIRSATGEVATKIPGVTFGRSLPRLAALADRLNIVRSYVPGDGNHDLKPLVGRDTSGRISGPCIHGSPGANHPRYGTADQRRPLPPRRRSFDPAGDVELRPVQRDRAVLRRATPLTIPAREATFD